jgi:hypothetical protein
MTPFSIWFYTTSLFKLLYNRSNLKSYAMLHRQRYKAMSNRIAWRVATPSMPDQIRPLQSHLLAKEHKYYSQVSAIAWQWHN